MTEKVPMMLYDRPLTDLSERPRPVKIKGRKQLLNAFNSASARLLSVQAPLETRFANGEFDGIRTITANINGNQPLTPDQQQILTNLRTLMDARALREGRKNLNVADFLVRRQTDQTAEVRAIRAAYAAGDFGAIAIGDQPTDDNIIGSRFVIPVDDRNVNNAIEDGVPVDGIIRNLDQKIQEIVNNQGGVPFYRRPFVNRELADLRNERDILYSASTQLFENDDLVRHARTEYEAYLKSIQSFFAENRPLDWVKAEKLVINRRVLNIPERGRNRLWGCLPLVLPFIAAVPIFWQLSHPAKPETPVVPAPIVITKEMPTALSACDGVANGNLRFEVFRDVDSLGNTPSIKGAIERQMAYESLRINQNEVRTFDDPEINSETARLYAEDPKFVQAYLGIAYSDYRQTAARILGLNGPSTGWIRATEFTPELLLASCQDPRTRFERAKILAQEIDIARPQ